MRRQENIPLYVCICMRKTTAPRTFYCSKCNFAATLALRAAMRTEAEIGATDAAGGLVSNQYLSCAALEASSHCRVTLALLALLLLRRADDGGAAATAVGLAALCLRPPMATAAVWVNWSLAPLLPDSTLVTKSALRLQPLARRG